MKIRIADTGSEFRTNRAGISENVEGSQRHNSDDEVTGDINISRDIF